MISRHLALNSKPIGTSGPIVYLMSRDQRVRDNHSLLRAQELALANNTHVLVLFCMLEHSGQRAREHYEFMIAGLRQVRSDLQGFNIPFVVIASGSSPLAAVADYLKDMSAAALVTDFSPLRGPRKLQKDLASNLDVQVEVVDTHNVVPVWIASNKQEYAARTIRPKISSKLPEYLIEPAALKPQDNVPSYPSPLQLESIALDHLQSNGTKVEVTSGEAAALKHTESFVADGLKGYAGSRNEPSVDGLSGLSPYLHYGQISSLRVALIVEEAATSNPSFREGADVLLEEMIIRKELADNYCLHTPSYRNISGAPNWARQTLQEHSSDEREYIYSQQQLEDAQTHDLAWNAAQNQLRSVGKMHGYMRMYWAKKVLEWTPDPQVAIDTLIYLNDFYSIDGGDPNGYCGIMWSVAGVHDRGWTERSVFGKIRYMNYAGLKRKFDIQAYEQRWNLKSQQKLI